MNRIRCRLLTDSGETAPETTDGVCAHRPLYRDSDGAVYHLGDEPFVADDGRTIQTAPVGALWDADWYRGIDDFAPGPDGMILTCRTPAGDWVIDQRNRLGGGWSRTGVAPDLTVTPSILIHTRPKKYHGWLRAGWLEECS